MMSFTIKRKPLELFLWPVSQASSDDDPKVDHVHHTTVAYPSNKHQTKPYHFLGSV